MQQENPVTIVCISDTHTQHSKIQNLPAGDILIHAGDMSNTGIYSEIESFCDWLDKLDFKHKIVIAGNHEVTFDEEFYESQHKNRFHHFKKNPENPKLIKERLNKSCIYLENASVNVMGINIYGSPYSPEFCDWAFAIKTENQARALWESIPENTDILVTHGPPYKILDQCKSKDHAGCIYLAQALEKKLKNIKYHIFGHIHEAYGNTIIDGRMYINCSTTTYYYKPTNEPFKFKFSRNLK